MPPNKTRLRGSGTPFSPHMVANSNSKPLLTHSRERPRHHKGGVSKADEAPVGPRLP